MFYNCFQAFGLAILMILAAATISSAQQEPTPEAIPGQYVVLLKETAEVKPTIAYGINTTNREQREAATSVARERNLAKVRSVYARLGIRQEAIQEEYADALVGFAAQLTDDQRRRAEADPDVEEVAQDYLLGVEFRDEPSNPGFLPFSTQVTPCGITAAGGPANGSGKATWIWILDTGIATNHSDLNVQTSGTYAKSFISGESVNDGHGHGTHVAGIAAAKNNSFGVVGVSAGAKVVPVKVLNNSKGKGPWSKVTKGLDHVAKYYIAGDVVNMSLGDYSFNNCSNKKKSLRKAIFNLADAGVHVVISSGNNSGDANKALPGCYNRTRVYTVGSITCNNTCASSSNFGSSVDWVAVGVNVYSTDKNGGYSTKSGTSMACPTVAGIIHARGGAPVSAGNITCKNSSYKKARR